MSIHPTRESPPAGQTPGDWEPNPKKLPRGLKGLCGAVKALGLDFGIWVEPKMVNVNSKLYRAHPDWAMDIPGREHSEGRGQRLLDLGSPAVQDYIIEAMTRVFSSADISYVKWDMNRIFSDVYAKGRRPEEQGEVFHRYVCGLYRCMKALTERFPHILFEGAAPAGTGLTWVFSVTSPKSLICYPIGTIGRDALYALINSYLLTFVLFTHTLDAAQLAAITGIMIAARVFDALNDPVMGNLIERTRSRYGKFKPWLAAGALSTSVVIYLMFNVRLQGWPFVCFFGVMYFAFSIAYTMNDISYWGMIPALGSDAGARDQFTSRATLCAGIGGTLAAMLIPMFTAGSGAIGGNTATAYGWVAVIIAVTAPLTQLFTLFGVRERREAVPADKPREKFSLTQVFRTIARNDQLVWVAVIFLIQQAGNGLVAGGLGSTYIYLTFGYSGGLYSLFNTVGMAATAFLMIFYPAISRRLPRKKLMGYMTVLSTAGYVLMLASAAIPDAGMGRFALLTGGYMCANFGYYCFYLIMMISIMNTVEYNELRFGERNEGIITSLRPFITKMGSALIVAATSASYLIFGVTGYTNQISALEQQCAQGLLSEEEKLAAIEQVIFGAAGGVSAGQSTGLLVTMTVIPWCLMLISYFLYKKKYKLDEAEYERICR